MIKNANHEYYCTRRVKGQDDVFMYLYLNYNTGGYDIHDPNQESVHFKSENVERDLVKVELVKEILLFVRKKLKTNQP